MDKRASSPPCAHSRAALGSAVVLSCAALVSTASGQTFQFTYHQVSANHRQVFGLAMADVDGDGDLDIVSGASIFKNPGGDMTGTWTRIALPVGDAMIVTDVDGDAFADVIANRTPDIARLEAVDAAGTQWARRAIVGQVPANSGFHATGQGYATAQIRPGGRPEIAFSGNDSRVYYFEIPATNPQAGNWPRVEITAQASEDGIAFCDVDRDGLPDLLAADMYGPIDNVAWFRNPGTGAGSWPIFRIGRTGGWVDRIAGADLNGDGRNDVVVTEENIGSVPDANVYWYEQPANPTSTNWTRHLLVRQYTTNSLDLADMDQDGDVDVVTGEHRGAKELAIWLNDGQGNFTKRLVDSGKESHLGARSADLDQDGDLDLVSICYDSWQFVHLWRHDRTGVPSAQVPRLGTPPNPNALRPGVTSGPVIGRTWDPVVDHTLFMPAATADFLLLALAPTNSTTPFGTLLCLSPVGHIHLDLHCSDHAVEVA
ncbi:MAG: VCBS repeat-containing protein [Planctomycetes bacterium]|nr:VCBS repeat-containing protein [Planctomycetota bacterium]